MRLRQPQPIRTWLHAGVMAVALVAAVLVLTESAWTQSTGTLAPVARQQFLDTSGRPIMGAKLYSWLAGTTTPTPLFQDASLTVPHPWPAEADGAGRLTFFLSATSYKFTLTDANDVAVWTVDNIQAVPSSDTNVDVTGTAGENLAERQVAYLSDGTMGGETAGRWYLADADNAYQSSTATLVGVVISPVISTLGSGQIRLQGQVEGYAGLSPGLTYYVSATEGGITSSAPGNAKVVGVAQTDSVLLLTPSAAVTSAVGAFTQVQVTGTALDALVVGGGIQTNAGAVQLVGADGRIAAIDSTRFASLSGANLTGIPETAGTETITGAWTFTNVTRYGSATAQPGFLARNSASDPGVTTGSVVDVDEEVYDTTNSFTADTFMAPVPGTYLFCGQIAALPSISSGWRLVLQTTSGSFQLHYANSSSTTGGGGDCIPLQMVQSGTAVLLVSTDAGTLTILGGVGAGGGYFTWFSGRLLP